MSLPTANHPGICRAAGGNAGSRVQPIDAVGWFDQHLVPYVKRADQAKMKDVAFIEDPDGYWIEIVEPSRLKAPGR